MTVLNMGRLCYVTQYTDFPCMPNKFFWGGKIKLGMKLGCVQANSQVESVDCIEWWENLCAWGN